MNISVNIATTGDRQDTLDQTVFSLIGQCDIIRVYNNKVLKDYGALAKFYYLGELEEDEIYLTCDDDLIYPPDYVEKMVNWIQTYKCIISLHGRILTKHAQKYYSEEHFGIRYFQEVKQPYFLDTGGTGVMGFDTKYFKPMIYNKPEKVCADLHCGLEAIKQGKKILSPPKKHLWVKGQETVGIYQREKNGTQEKQIRLMNEILDWKHGNTI